MDAPPQSCMSASIALDRDEAGPHSPRSINLKSIPVTPSRDLVTCRQCGAVLGRYVARRTGRQAGTHPDPVARIDLGARVRMYMVQCRVDVSCPDCGHVRTIDVTRRAVVAGGHAA